MGNDSKYVAVSWTGDVSQIGGGNVVICPDYWRNVYNAFATSSPLAHKINGLTGSAKSQTVIAAFYGKIVQINLTRGGFPPIAYNPNGWHEAAFRFDSCYINPTPNDRNLEYDQRNNLAPETEAGYQWPP